VSVFDHHMNTSSIDNARIQQLSARSLPCYNPDMSTAEIIAELPRLSSAELAQVQAKLKELVEPARDHTQTEPVAVHPAIGIWKDRIDLPDGSIEASNLLRERMMRRSDTETDTTK
jgi:hypothetical protein